MRSHRQSLLAKFWMLSVSLLFMMGFVVSLPAYAAVPIVDDTTFIATSGKYQSGMDDYDVMILREKYYGASGVDLSGYASTGTSVITNNPANFGVPDLFPSYFEYAKSKLESKGIYANKFVS